MACFGTYFDDSGSHEGSPVTVVGGVAASKDQWDKWMIEWYQRLEVDHIKVLHMKDLMRRKNEFAGWSQNKEVSLMKDLTEILRRYVRVYIGVVIPQANFEIAKSQVPNTQRTPKQLCAERCVVKLTIWADRHKHEEIDNMKIFFEEKIKVTTDLIKLFTHPHYPNWKAVYGNKKRDIPLQAADLFAYELFRHYRNEVEQNGKPVRKALESLLNGPELYLTIFEVETIIEHLHDLPLLNSVFGGS